MRRPKFIILEQWALVEQWATWCRGAARQPVRIATYPKFGPITI